MVTEAVQEREEDHVVIMAATLKSTLVLKWLLVTCVLGCGVGARIT